MQNVGLINRAPVKWVGNSGVAAKKSHEIVGDVRGKKSKKIGSVNWTPQTTFQLKRPKWTP